MVEILRNLLCISHSTPEGLYLLIYLLLKLQYAVKGPYSLISCFNYPDEKEFKPLAEICSGIKVFHPESLHKDSSYLNNRTLT